MLSEDALTSWWERMTPDTRALVVEYCRAPIRPDLALHIWQESGYLPVVKPGRAGDDAQRLAWGLAPEVTRFVTELEAGVSGSPERVA